MKKILKITTAVLFGLTVMTGCSDSDDNDISDRPLQGKVFGETFVAKGGKAFDSGDEISVHITTTVVGCESYVNDYDLTISTYVPAKVGSYDDINVVFGKDGETPLNYLDGDVEVVSITDTTVTVKIEADSSDNNDVEGIFTVSYCTE